MNIKEMDKIIWIADIACVYVYSGWMCEYI